MGLSSQMHNLYKENNALLKDHRQLYKDYINSPKGDKSVYQYKEATPEIRKKIRGKMRKQQVKEAVCNGIALLFSILLVGIILYLVLL